MEQLDRFSNISFIVSIDGFEQLNEQIRKNSVWKTLVDNLDILAKRYGGYGIFMINTVVQRNNVNNLLELGTWIESKNITKWRLNLLDNPSELHYSNCENIYIPDELLELSLVNTNIENSLVLKNIKNYAKTT